MQVLYYPKTIINLFLSLFTQNIWVRKPQNNASCGKWKFLTISIFLSLAGQTVFAQAPTIASFSPSNGAVGTTVTITGAAFNTTAANNVVFFGATRATVTAASTTSLTVTVPTGATYAAITVLNTATSLAAYSSKFFLPTFTPNKGSVTSADIAPGVDFATGSSPQSVAIGDIDGDGKPDIVVANTGSSTISVLLNTSSAGSFSFAPKVDFSTQQGPYSVAIGDLDGDGKPDIVVSNGSETSIAVFRNTSSPGIVSFATALGFKTGSFPWSVAIGDLDGDGRADIVVGNYGDNTVSVLHNLGNPGNISFDAKMDIAVGSTPWSVAIGDIDGDNKPEIVVANTGSATISVLLNTSSPGIVNFAPKADFTTVTGSKSVAIGDIDGDGKPDIAVAISGNVSVLQNTGSSGHINFAAPASFAAGPNLWPITIGDIDGDGKPDIVTANVTTGSSVVSVLANTSSTGSISFAAQTAFAAEGGPFSVAIGDIDGDGKPDIVVANGNGFSVLRNTQVFTPSVTSFTPASGPVGTLVTITGANLGSPTAFTIGGVTAIVVSNTGTQLVGMVMPGATTGSVSLTTPGGLATGAGNFAVIATPFPSAQQGGEIAVTGPNVAVSADGNTAAIGFAADTGSVSIYTRSGGTWTQQGNKIIVIGSGSALNAISGTNSVALSGDGNTLLVGKASDNFGLGAAWVYTRSGTVWTQQAKLVGAGYITGDPAAEGTSVALSADGNTAVIGGPNDNNYAGAVWVFTRSNGTWTQQGNKLTGTGYMGTSVAISADGKTIAAGAPNDATYVGSIWVYALSGGVWTQQGSKFSGTHLSTQPFQGWSVALSADGNTLAEGGINETINGTSSAGAVWVFTRSGSTWTQQGSTISGNDFVGNAEQGYSVRLSADGNTLAFGGPTDNDSLGATWVFTRSAGTWTQSGPKSIGTGATSGTPSGEGYSVGLSADGSTLVEGASGYYGGAWVFTAQLPPAPSITSVSPTSGPVGTLVTIVGTNLGNPTTFTIGGTTAIVVSNNGTQLVGMVMPGATTGAVTVTTAAGTASGGNFTVKASLFPAVQQGNKLVGTGSIGTTVYQGNSVAVSADGNTAVVGGPIDNNQTGAVWIYTRSGTTWTQQGAKLVGTGSVGNAEQGYAVAISADGNTVIEGGYNDNAGLGSAWVFTRSNGIWTQQGAKFPLGTLMPLSAGNGQLPPALGFSVALSADGNTAVVGALNYTVPTNNLVISGAAAVYNRSGGAWQQTALLIAPATTRTGQGSSVALSADGNTALVGGDGGGILGSAWIYTYSSGAWQTGVNIQIQPNDNVGATNFGYSAALSADGNTAIIGGPSDNNNVGAAWIFTRSGTSWTQQGSKLVDPASNSPDEGTSVAISADGNTVLVGEPGTTAGGAISVYTRNGNTWTKQSHELQDPNATTANQGEGVSLSADASTAIVGGAGDNTGQGAAWVYVPAPPDATLSTLTLSSGTFSPVFAPGTNNYNVSVTNTTSSVTVTPTANGAGATIKVNGTAVTSGSASAAINLKAGANTISVVVTAQDGTTTDTYTLTVIRASVTAPNISYAGPQTYPAAVKITTLSPTNSGGGVPAIAFSQTATFEKGVISPVGVVADASGNVFTTSGRYIYKIAPGGQPVVFAGSGAQGNANGQGTAASFGALVGLAIDAQGNLYAADADNNLIRKVTPQAVVTTFAGSGNAGLADGAGTVASFNTPMGVAVAADGSVYVSDSGNKAIRKITTAGVVSTIAVASTTDTNYMFSMGIGITVDGANNIYIVDPAYFVIRKFTQAGAMSIVAGVSTKQGYADGPVAAAQFYNPYGITLDAQNNLYVSDYYGIREITTDGMVTTIAGYGGPGGPTTSVDGIGKAAIFQGSSGQISADGKGKLYLAELNNSAIRTISYVGYAINNTLPNGLTFNYLTGGITGTPTTVSPAANYAVTGYNLGGKSTANINIAVTANSSLSSLKLSKGTLSPVFAAGTTSYTAMETNSTASVTVTPTAIDPLATITVNGTSVKSGSPSGAIALSVGSNTVITKVTGQDGTTTQSDTITVIRPSTNAKLAVLKVGSGTLTPAFNANTTSYTLSVPYTTTSLTITPTVAVAGATVTVNGTTVTSGQSSAAVALSVGGNTVSTIVTAQDGVTTDTYTIAVTRAAPSANASLANIVVSKGTLSPAFATGTGSYTDLVTNGTTSLTLTPTAADATANITVNGTAIASGKASGAIALAIGSNTINVVVTAQDGTTTQSYTVTVIRPSTNAKLAGLTLSSGTLSPAFNSATVTYNTSVPYTASTITVTPTVAVTGATVKVNGTVVITGNASQAIALTVGSNTITTVVTAQDGVTTTTYTVTVTRAAPSANDNLSALTISKGTLSPAFATVTTAYTDMVTNGTASLTVTPTLADATAIVTVNGTTVASGSASGAIALSVGSNPIAVTITAQSGASKTYMVTVTRPSTNAKLAGLTISSGTLAPAFNTNTTSYTASVTNATASITVTPTVAVTGATITINGTAATSGSPSGAIALSVGANKVAIIVTAQDGITTDTYNINVTRAAPGINIPDQQVSVQTTTDKPLFDDDNIVVHQGISPNGDGINDFLQIDNISQYPENHLSIMNRNGQLVFEAKGYDNATKVFDGHSNKTGQMQLPGTYFYSLDYTAKGVIKHKTGFLVLKY